MSSGNRAGFVLQCGCGRYARALQGRYQSEENRGAESDRGSEHQYSKIRRRCESQVRRIERENTNQALGHPGTEEQARDSTRHGQHKALDEKLANQLTAA